MTDTLVRSLVRDMIAVANRIPEVLEVARAARVEQEQMKAQLNQMVQLIEDNDQRVKEIVDRHVQTVNEAIERAAEVINSRLEQLESGGTWGQHVRVQARH